MDSRYLLLRLILKKLKGESKNKQEYKRRDASRLNRSEKLLNCKSKKSKRNKYFRSKLTSSHSNEQLTISELFDLRF